MAFILGWSLKNVFNFFWQPVKVIPVNDRQPLNGALHTVCLQLYCPAIHAKRYDKFDA